MQKYQTNISKGYQLNPKYSLDQDSLVPGKETYLFFIRKLETCFRIGEKSHVCNICDNDLTLTYIYYFIYMINMDIVLMVILVAIAFTLI